MTSRKGRGDPHIVAATGPSADSLVHRPAKSGRNSQSDQKAPRETDSLVAFAIKAAQCLHQEARLLAKRPKPDPFFSILSSTLSNVKERLEIGAPVTEKRISKLLPYLERLAKWPDRFHPPKSPFTPTSYPCLARALRKQENNTRSCILNLVKSQSGLAKNDRMKFLKSFTAFANVKREPRGPDLSNLSNSNMTSSPSDDTTQCLQQLYSTLCKLCHCPLAEDSGAFKANVDPNILSRSAGTEDGVTVDIFFLHSHTSDDDGASEWKETRVRVIIERSGHNSPTGSKTVRFAQTGSNVTNICSLIRSQEVLGRLKLSASSHGLFEDAIEPGIDFSLQEPSTSLATVISSHVLKGNDQRKLLLSYLLAKAVWQFYDSHWMTEDWTKHRVQFMRQRAETMQKNAPLNPRPFILAELGASPRYLNSDLNQTESSHENEETTKSRCPRTSTHIFPKVLALGVILLEIQMEEGIENRHSSDFFDANGQIRGNASHITAGKFITSDEWARRTDILKSIRQVIEICVRPDTGKLGTDPTRIRDNLHNYIVTPLRKLFDTMYECPGGSPERFNPGPMRFDLVDERKTNSSTHDLIGMRSTRQAHYTDVEQQQSHSDDIESAHFASIVDLQPIQGSSLDSESIAMGVEDYELFGNYEEEPYNTRGCKEADQWVSKFKEQRVKYSLGRAEEYRVKVAILDTGIDSNHPCVAKNSNRIKDSKSFVGSGTTEDISGHGTHIAGIVLELTDNVDLYVAKFTEDRMLGGEENNLVKERIVRALRHARTVWKVHMISLSFGFNKTSTPDTIRQELEECLNQKIVVFASASNDGGNRPRTYPGNYDRVLCIHSATGKGKGSSFSPPPKTNSYNFSVIGECIESWWPLPNPNQVHSQKTTKRKSGTSFATPVAVSVAAFMVGFIRKCIQDFKPNIEPLSPEGVQKILSLVSQGNKIDGYDYISLEWFFMEHSIDTIKGRLRDKLK